jgi:tRNA(Ile)-lysidine synthase TilS/MesJ
MDNIRCTNCLISENFPGVTLDSNNLCNFCNDTLNIEKDKKTINTNHEQIQKVINERKGISNYDVLVAYSGGKDSTFTLYYLKEVLKLKVLALLIDNDFIAVRAHENARIITSALKIDLLIFKPESNFMHTLYNKSLAGNFYTTNQLTRANAACLSCINLVNNIVLNEAIIRRIPIIAGGYIGGQIPSESGVVKLDRTLIKEMRNKNTEMISKQLDERASFYLNLSDPSNQQLYPVLINPLLGMDYNEDEILKIISKYGWIKPDDTGLSSSNCLMNDYAIAVHYKRYKFHSYEAEICLQVRRKTLSKEEGLKRLSDIKIPEKFTKIIEKLNNK